MIPTPVHAWLERLFVAVQYLLPHHLLSRLMYRLTRSEWRVLKDRLIRTLIRLYDVDLSEAANPDPAAYRSFNDFFTRALRPDARPQSDDPRSILSPADGLVSELGDIRSGRLLQAKGRDYSLLELLGGDGLWAERFLGGRFATIYLSPRDYHRVHAPLSGALSRMIHVPGRLFSVNPITTRWVPGLFSRNERVVCLFETQAGPLAVILVGAIFVASIDTIWSGPVAPAYRQVRRWDFARERPLVELERGAELGRFNMGSTVILLLGPGMAEWDPALVPGAKLRQGQSLGRVGGETSFSFAWRSSLGPAPWLRG